MSDLSESSLLSFNQKVAYWKVVVFKMLNGWFITVGASLAVAGILSDHTTKIILVLVGGSKFLEGFIDQEVVRTQQKVKEDTQHFVKAQIMKLLIIGGLTALLLTGCMTDPATGQPFPAYVPDSAGISNTMAKIQSAISLSAPVNPYAPLMATGAQAAAVLLTAGSGLLAFLKSKQASKASAVAATLAQGVVKAGDAAKSVVLDHASNTPLFAAVAGHINDATP